MVFFKLYVTLINSFLHYITLHYPKRLQGQSARHESGDTVILCTGQYELLLWCLFNSNSFVTSAGLAKVCALSAVLVVSINIIIIIIIIIIITDVCWTQVLVGSLLYNRTSQADRPRTCPILLQMLLHRVTFVTSPAIEFQVFITRQVKAIFF